MPSESTEWEYFTWEKITPKGEYADIEIHNPYQHSSEATAAQTFWQKHQAMFRRQIQPYLDQGWEPITEIGPGCLIVKASSEHSKGFLQSLVNMSAVGYNWWLVGYHIEFRRRKRK